MITRDEVIAAMNRQTSASVRHVDYFWKTGGGEASHEQMMRQCELLKTADEASAAYRKLLKAFETESPAEHEKFLTECDAFDDKYELSHRRLFPSGRAIGDDA